MTYWLAGRVKRTSVLCSLVPFFAEKLKLRAPWAWRDRVQFQSGRLTQRSTRSRKRFPGLKCGVQVAGTRTLAPVFGFLALRGGR